MYETKQTLIVVYKDELLMNQLKKMVETNDDSDDEIVGTRDNSINIVSWIEQVWLDNKKAGNIQGKILFLGDIKGTDKLIPVIDVSFDDCGVKYGWAGNQAIVFADPKKLAKKEDYELFMEKFCELPTPDLHMRKGQNMILDLKRDKDNQSASKMIREKKVSDTKVFQIAKDITSPGVKAVKKIGDGVAEKSEEIFRNKILLKRQMLLYGVINLYNNGLETFMNL